MISILNRNQLSYDELLFSNNLIMTTLIQFKLKLVPSICESGFWLESRQQGKFSSIDI